MQAVESEVTKKFGQPMYPEEWDLDAVFDVSFGFPAYFGYRCGHWNLGASLYPGPVYRIFNHKLCPKCYEETRGRR